MSKRKSAMQKGYRKQVKAKPFVTKKDIISLIIIVAVIVLGVVLFNLFYDDGFLSAKQVQENDLVTYASTDNRSRYKKVAEVGEKEGFVRTSTATEESPIGSYVFEPETEMDDLASVSVGASFVNAASLTESFVAYAEAAGVEVMEPVETTINGKTAYVFAYEAAYYSQANDPEYVEGEEIDVSTKENNTFEQHISAYIDIEGTHTISLQANLTGEDESFYMPHEEVETYLVQFADVINVEFEAK